MDEVAMKRSRAYAAMCAFAMLATVSCGLDRPRHADGRNVLVLHAIDTSGVYEDGWRGAPNAQVEVSSTTFVYKKVFSTDEEGRLVLEDLPAGDYYIQASMRDEVNRVLLTGQKRKLLEGAEESTDTLFMSFVPLSPVVLNEIYFCGCNGAIAYYFDQYTELYNSTADTIYLDGYIMCRSTQVDYVLDWEAIDFALAYYVYKFPGVRGVTRECPIAPHDYLVLASDAVNHNQFGALCVNLLQANYEFFCAFSSDYDNLLVPNLLPLSTTGNEFSYNIAHCALWLATGEEYTHAEHCYTSSSGGQTCSPYVEIPLYTIIDAVEYSANPSSPRYMTIRLDAALGGNGITRYSGVSMERKVPGFDTNNSAFDFETTVPTPGYSHVR
jgi:hypothetical protein